MDEHSQPRAAEADATNVNTPVANAAAGTVSGAAPAGAVFPAGTVFPAGSSGGPVVYAATPLQQLRLPLQQQDQDQHQQQLQDFGTETLAEIEHMSEIKPHSLPHARVKKIMKASGENVQMIASEAPGLLAKASEIFIQELALRSWLQTKDNNRRTLQKNDIAAAVSRDETFDFLVDVMQDNGVGFPSASAVQTAVPGMGAFGMYYGNQQPVPFAWPQPEQQQQPTYSGESGVVSSSSSRLPVMDKMNEGS